MSASQTINRPHVDQMLREAIDERRRLTLTHHGPDGWRVFKGEFDSGSPAAKEVRVQLTLDDDADSACLPRTGEGACVTFRVGHKKSMFDAVIRGIGPADQQWLATLDWPTQIHQYQRRVFERAAPPRDGVIAVRIWREGDSGEVPAAPRNIRHGQLEDLSAGGMRVSLAAPREIEIGAIYRCAFTPRPGEPAIVTDALARHREAGEQVRSAIGFQFIGLEASPEGRRLLDRLARTVTFFQRVNARRKED